MPLVACPSCWNTSEMPMETIGKKVRCRHCGFSVQMEMAKSLEKLKVAVAVPILRRAPVLQSTPQRKPRGSRLVLAVAAGIVTVVGVTAWGIGWAWPAYREAAMQAEQGRKLEAMYRGIADACEDRNFELALRRCNEILEAYPQEARACSERASVHWLECEREKALADCSAAIEMGYSHAYWTRSNICESGGRRDLAVEAMTAYLRHNPQSAGGWARRDDLYWDMKLYDSALADLDEAARLNPEEYRLWARWHRDGTYPR